MYSNSNKRNDEDGLMKPRNTEKVLLKIMEEAGEVIQICSKCIFYGVDNVSPKPSNLHQQSNKELLIEEMGDIIANFRVLIDNTDAGITWGDVNLRADNKYIKLENYLPEA